jgi:hypothetical protein
MTKFNDAVETFFLSSLEDYGDQKVKQLLKPILEITTGA